jgi:hypothetical protein
MLDAPACPLYNPPMTRFGPKRRIDERSLQEA